MRTMQPLVSIITPCYNGEHYLERYFRSLLNQTYRNIEIVFVNDGSFDRTEEIAALYEKEFIDKNIPFQYLKQDNSGQAAALNKGLSYIHGKYLIWPDADDELLPESIEKRVAFLEKNPDYGAVRSSGCYINGETEERLGSVNSSLFSPPDKEDIFLDLITESTYCTSGCYMIRVDLFRAIYPENQIFESRAGQNWQLIIPVAGKQKCGYIDAELYRVTVHPDSHSRQQRSAKEQAERLAELKRILEIAVKRSGRRDRIYSSIIERKYQHLLLKLYSDYDQKDEAKHYYELLKRGKELTEGEERAYLRQWYPVKFFFYRVKKRIGRIRGNE